MPIYRAYAHPDNPVVYQALALDAPQEDVKYSRELKTACLLGAGPQPPAPPLCPRCHDRATFQSRICYKFGLAGAWNMLCRKCGQVHIPDQVGPTEGDLEGIESIRDRDRQSLRAKKDAKIRNRGKQTAKGKTCERRAKVSTKGTDSSTVDTAQTNKRPRASNAMRQTIKASESAALEESRPFGTISNAISLEAIGVREHGAVADLQPHQPWPTVTKDQSAQRNKRRFDVMEPFDPEERTIVLVLWEKAGEDPFIDRLPVPMGGKLFLFHHPRVRAIPPPTQFEQYVFIAKIWSAIPWDISPIELHPKDDVMFVRIMDVQCRGFGQQLHDYQLDRGHALPLQQRLAHVLYEPPKRHRWILVWDNDHAPPKIFLVDAQVFDDAQDDALVPRPWMELLRDAPFFLIWHELQTRWRGVLPDRSPQVPDDAPIILLAHPAVETLLGSGEAIAWFDSWRATHRSAVGETVPKPASRADTQARSSAKRIQPTRTYTKKLHSRPPLRTGALSSSDEEPEFDSVGSTTPRVTLLAKTVARPHAARQSDRALDAVIVISDDDREFVQGSSSSPMKLKRREREVIDLTSP